MVVDITPAGTRGSGGGTLTNRVAKPLLQQLQVLLFRRTGGWGMRVFGAPMLLLNTVGAKSGRLRTNPVAYSPDGNEGWLVVASAAGSTRHPAYYRNMASNLAQVWIEVARSRLRVTVESLRVAARAEAWGRSWPVPPFSGLPGQDRSRDPGGSLEGRGMRFGAAARPARVARRVGQRTTLVKRSSQISQRVQRQLTWSAQPWAGCWSYDSHPKRMPLGKRAQRRRPEFRPARHGRPVAGPRLGDPRLQRGGSAGTERPPAARVSVHQLSYPFRITIADSTLRIARSLARQLVEMVAQVLDSERGGHALGAASPASDASVLATWSSTCHRSGRAAVPGGAFDLRHSDSATSQSVGLATSGALVHPARDQVLQPTQRLGEPCSELA